MNNPSFKLSRDDRVGHWRVLTMTNELDLCYPSASGAKQKRLVDMFHNRFTNGLWNKCVRCKGGARTKSVHVRLR